MLRINGWMAFLTCSALAVASAAAAETAAAPAAGTALVKQAAPDCNTNADCAADRICLNGSCVGISTADPSASSASEEGGELPGLLGILSAGPVFENSYGGFAFSVALAAGGHGSYFTIGVHLRTGARWEDDDPKVEPGAELGYRFMTRLPSGMIPHFVLALGYSHLTQFDEGPGTVYHWSVPHGRLGGGLMWGPAFGPKFGFEVSYFGGYAFHDNAYENPWGQIYEWPYNGGHVHFIMAF